MAVKPESKMDAETLIRHINARHTPIAGQTEFRTGNDPAEKLMRQWHQHVHFRGYDDNEPARTVNHEHVE